MEYRRSSGYTVAKAARTQSEWRLRRPEERCVFRRDSGSLTFDVTPSGASRWRAVARVLRSPVDALSCALLPSFCNLCGSPLPQLSFAPICNACWSEFPIQSGPACARCGDTLDAPAHAAGLEDADLCRRCRMVPPAFVRAVAFGLYQGRMKAAIHALKYDGLHPAARTLGKMLALSIAQLADEAPAEMLVVPIPLHRSKHAERGFNQARALAEYALESLRRSHPEWRLTLAGSTLMRLRATATQAGLTMRQRRLNVRGAFSVSDRTLVDSKHILVIDDIYTTGSTARAAAEVLMRAGAASVWVATLARARRVSDIGYAAQLNTEDSETDGGFSSIATTELQQERNYSSQDQPSF